MEENNPNRPQTPDESRTAPVIDMHMPESPEPPVAEDAPGAPSPSVVAPLPVDQPSSPSLPGEGAARAPVDQHKPAATPKHSAPITPIIIALVVAAILAVVTVITFKNTSAPESSENTQTSTQVESAVTPESIDATSTEIDQTLDGVDESSDFPEDELSDQTLGL